MDLGILPLKIKSLPESKPRNSRFLSESTVGSTHVIITCYIIQRCVISYYTILYTTSSLYHCIGYTYYFFQYYILTYSCIYLLLVSYYILLLVLYTTSSLYQERVLQDRPRFQHRRLHWHHRVERHSGKYGLIRYGLKD